MLDFCGDVLQLMLPGGDLAALRRLLDEHFAPSDAIVLQEDFRVPDLFVSDMDSTMIGQECIDELADFAGLKPQIAAITERAMQGELDFEAALRERVGLLAGLAESRDRPVPERNASSRCPARALWSRRSRRGAAETVLVTGGFHHFADPVAGSSGFERVVGNRLAVAHGKLTGGLVGAITDSAVKEKVLREEAALLGATMS